MKDFDQKNRAVALFDKYCGIQEEAVEYDSVQRDKILQFTGGLPIAIAHIGTFVRRKRWRWTDVYNLLREAPEEGLINTHSGVTPEGTLFRVFNSGLDDLDLHPSSCRRWLNGEDLVQVQENFERKPFSILYAALAVLRREYPQAPFYILAYLWGFDLRLTKKIAELFQGCELLVLEPPDDVDDEKNCMCVLHDLEYMHSVALCSNLSHVSRDWPDGQEISLPLFHRRLLSNFCEHQLGAAALTPRMNWSLILPGSGVDVTTVDWYMVTPGGEFHHNVERHMVEAELEEEFLTELSMSLANNLSRISIEETLRETEASVYDLESLVQTLMTERDNGVISAEDFESFMEEFPSMSESVGAAISATRQEMAPEEGQLVSAG